MGKQSKTPAKTTKPQATAKTATSAKTPAKGAAKETPKVTATPWDISQDKGSTGYIDKVLGIEGGGAIDTTGKHTTENLKTTVDTLRGYNKNYGFCTENELAHKWYLDNKSGASADAKKKIGEIMGDKRLSRDQKIKSSYDALSEDLEKTEEGKKKWEQVKKDQAEIDKNFPRTAAPKDETTGKGKNKKTNEKIIARCSQPSSFSACVAPDKNKKYLRSQAVYDKINKDAGTSIDFKQIEEYENGPYTAAYVPWGLTKDGKEPASNNSGITIGTGFDIGQQNETDLKNIGLSEALRKKLKPYCGLKKQDACDYLTKHPLELTQDEIDEIDSCKKLADAKAFKKYWDGAVDSETGVKFSELHKNQQTVLFSRNYQEGGSWKDKTTYKKFLDYAKVDDWESAATEYESIFNGHIYQKRLEGEHDLLVKANEELAKKAQ